MANKSEIQKIKRYSHILRKVLTVFYWVAVVGACVSLIAAVASIFFIPDSNFTLNNSSTGRYGFSLDGLIKYDITEAALGINMKNAYISILFMAVMVMLLVIIVAKQLIHILKSLEEDKPFVKENAVRISSIGIVLVLSSFLIPVFEYIVAWTMLDLLKIQNISLNYSVNIYLVLAGFLMFVLSGIFKYGSFLQNEYDETV